MRYINGETKQIIMIPSDTYREGEYFEFTIEGKNTIYNFCCLYGILIK